MVPQLAHHGVCAANILTTAADFALKSVMLIFGLFII